MATMPRQPSMPDMPPRPSIQPMCPCGTSGGRAHALWCGGGSFFKKFMCTLAGVLLVYVIFYVGTLIRNNIRKYDTIGRSDKMERTITVNGYGKVTGNNDIAVTSIGYSNTDKDVSVAQAANKKVMDSIATELKRLGIDDKDLQTDYSIYPDYNYTQDKGQELKGYRVNSNVTVKIRDLSKIPTILSLAGKYGATQVSGLSFTIDDPENLKTAAREKALANAHDKAEELGAALGVRMTEVVSYSEYEGAGGGYYDYSKSMVGYGGSGEGAQAYAPDVSSGSHDEIMNVSITYAVVPVKK